MKHDGKLVFIAAPDDQAGGGMGRVKDYILRAGPDEAGRATLVPLITRDMRGAPFSMLLLFQHMLTIAGAAMRGRAGLVHVHMGDRGSAFRKGALLLFARLCGVQTLLHLHAVELERHYAAAHPLLRWAIRLPFRASNSVVVLGERFRTWLVNDLHIESGKIETLLNGVDVDPVPPIRSFLPGREQTILFLGNMIERKGLSDLIAALGALPADVEPWRLVIAGGGYREPYEEQAEALGIRDRITITGWVDQPGARALLRQADMLVLPSYEEGLPLVILEALGAALPVICTPVGSIAETLVDGETALFCAPGDRPGLSARIATLLRDQPLQQQLSSSGRALFDRLFSLAAFHRALFTIYRNRHGIEYAPKVQEGLSHQQAAVKLG